MTDISHRTLLEHEARFHDERSSHIDLSKANPHLFFTGSTSPENRFILAQLGELAGKRVLELGCGVAEASVYLSQHGANCTATDCSPATLRLADKLARRHGVTITTRVMDSMSIDYPDSTFDIVYAANVLHHTDHLLVLREMHRVLKPGGLACFWDPLKHNPVINVYRRMATEVRSHDEHPLHIRVLSEVRKLFRSEVHDTFWYCTLWIFMRFFLVERVSPNDEPYWKKIIYEEERLRPIYNRLDRCDRLIKRIPFLRRFAWNIAVVARK